jgi:hypothetical protein
MMDRFTNNPFFLDIWKSYGTIRERILSSGLTILTKEKKEEGEDAFERVILTDEGEVLDFHYHPKKPEPPPEPEPSPRDIERINELMKKVKRQRRKK